MSHGMAEASLANPSAVGRVRVRAPNTRPRARGYYLPSEKSPPSRRCSAGCRILPAKPTGAVWVLRRTSRPDAGMLLARALSMDNTNASLGTSRHEVPPPVRRSVFIEEAAVLLGVSRRTVYSRIRDGRLRTTRTSGGSQRVLMESIEAFRRASGRKPYRRKSQPEPLALQIQALPGNAEGVGRQLDPAT